MIFTHMLFYIIYFLFFDDCMELSSISMNTIIAMYFDIIEMAYDALRQAKEVRISDIAIMYFKLLITHCFPHTLCHLRTSTSVFVYTFKWIRLVPIKIIL